MSNIPTSLTDSALTRFKLAVSASDPCMVAAIQQNLHLNFHLHMPDFHLLHHHYHDHREHHRKVSPDEMEDIPKGCVAVLVGQEEERLQRFVIPVMYVNHPLFSPLLKEAEEEYGFEQQGPITIPCQVEEFRNVQGLIDQERHHDHHHAAWCFRA